MSLFVFDLPIFIVCAIITFVCVIVCVIVAEVLALRNTSGPVVFMVMMTIGGVIAAGMWLAIVALVYPPS